MQKFTRWMKKHDLTNEAAADILAVSPRMVAYYKDGSYKPNLRVRRCMLAYDARVSLKRGSVGDAEKALESAFPEA